MVSFLHSLVIAVLSAYLSFTNFLATELEQALGLQTPNQPTTVATAPPDTRETAEHQIYQIAPPIPDILREHAWRQPAAVTSATQATDTITTSYDHNLADVLVNIYCTHSTDTHKRITTGTGAFIDTKGIILTNAHVAQFLLLAHVPGADVGCVIRAGNPAIARYEAELLFISPQWITEHASLISEPTPRGTGERDYALLYVARTVDGTPLPTQYPTLTRSSSSLSHASIKDVVSLGGYPANDTTDVPDDLRLVIATSSIAELFTFGEQHADLMALTGSAVGMHGSSGGPVIDETGALIGLITTRGDDAVLGAGSLRALTLGHINRTIITETGFSLTDILSGEPAEKARVFRSILEPFLANALRQALEY